MLTDEHINYIIRDLWYRGIVAEPVRDELIDHVCSGVEARMQTGLRFIDAYTAVLKSFGNTGGLRKTQREILQSENKKITHMLHNYFTTGWRSLLKNRFYTLINVFGLAIGIASCLIIVLFVADELQYDAWNPDAGRIYRVHCDLKFAENEFKMTYRSAPEANALQQEYPEVEATVRFRSMGSYLVRAESASENIKETNVVWTDSTFFRMFPVAVLEGDARSALREPASIAISRSTAEKHFPGRSAMGQSLILDNNYHGIVKAVYEDMPSATHFHFNILVAMVGNWPVAREAQQTSFMSENFMTYVLLKKGADAKALENKLPGFMERHMGPEMATAMGKDFSMKKFLSAGNRYNLSLMPLRDIHLYSDVRGEFEANGSITYVYLFMVIGGLILLVACINFMNLSTARSANRAKEVGVRKVMGSLRSHLVRQFLMESGLVTVASFVLALGLAWAIIPVFNELSQKQLVLPFGSGIFYAVILLACIFIGLLAGLYPAFFLSAFKPVNVLRGKGSAASGSRFVRSSLVVFQFIVSIFLIVGAITVNRQLSFIQQRKLGYEKDQVIIVHEGYALRPGSAAAFRDEVLKNPLIESGTVTGYVPVDHQDSYRSSTSYWRQGQDPAPDNMVSTQHWSIDYDYVKTFRMNITEGRNFSQDFPSDSSAVIINQTAAAQFGLGKDVIGRRICTFEDGQPLDGQHITCKTIVGVVEDFHYSSLKEGIHPVILLLNKSDGSISFRFKPGDTQAVIAGIGGVWKRLAPGQPFSYTFMDEDFAKMYSSESRLSDIFIIFAGLAILIACLGLFALTAFMTEQRTKEIGIRKVLGASVDSLVILLSRDFGKLIVIAFVIAAPLAWYAVEWWLKRYQYKTEIGPLVYLLAGAIAMVIALITMSYQSIRAAGANPVKSLRSE